MKPVILFRSDNSTELNQEKEVAAKYFPVYSYRSEIPKDSLVIGRYSVLPYYKELEIDLHNNSSKLINTTKEHHWIASFDYYHDLKEHTPRSWNEYEFPYSDYNGPLVIKGKTNSRKAQWSTKMYAKDRQAGIKIAIELATDPLIGPQGLIYREFVPLKTYEIDSINGQKYTNEWRLFFLHGSLLCYGYYWSSASEKTIADAHLNDLGLQFGIRMGHIASHHASFYVIDIAETETGQWIVIEINDGQMSGLSENDADRLYSVLAESLPMQD